MKKFLRFVGERFFWKRIIVSGIVVPVLAWICAEGRFDELYELSLFAPAGMVFGVALGLFWRANCMFRYSLFGPAISALIFSVLGTAIGAVYIQMLAETRMHLDEVARWLGVSSGGVIGLNFARAGFYFPERPET